MEAIGGLTEGEIRLRAYRIWQWLGCPEGYEAEIWARAEKELRDEQARAREAADEPVSPPP